MHIRRATTDHEIDVCFPVMSELRPHLVRPEVVALVRRMEREGGFELAFLEDDETIVAVAGYRILDDFARGRYLYVDDLVTAAAHRSRGYGSGLLDWLRAEAARRGCGRLHLDSGMQRKDAHRFYEREGLGAVSLHFAVEIASGGELVEEGATAKPDVRRSPQRAAREAGRDA
ncbi:MAG: GNAT family N-acetyltransferase [Phycisphaerales bacterium]|nr:GNAT family N-acetyltransferase [Phycisphaerales bacterium]